jgi:hypothetical protein
VSEVVMENIVERTHAPGANSAGHSSINFQYSILFLDGNAINEPTVLLATKIDNS